MPDDSVIDGIAASAGELAATAATAAASAARAAEDAAQTVDAAARKLHAALDRKDGDGVPGWVWLLVAAVCVAGAIYVVRQLAKPQPQADAATR